MFGLLDQPLPVAKDLPSPDGKWELVEVIGKLGVESVLGLLAHFLTISLSPPEVLDWGQVCIQRQEAIVTFVDS